MPPTSVSPPSSPDEVQLTTKAMGHRVSLRGSALAVVSTLSIVGMLVITFLFIDYLGEHERLSEAALVRMEASQEAVSHMRIQQCHRIQEESTKSMERIAESLDVEAIAMAQLAEAIHTLDDSVKQHSQEIRDIKASLRSRD